MELIKKIIELIVALSKLGWAHVVDLFPRKAQKFFDDLEKKPIDSQPKNGTSEYISIESDKFLDEKEESRQREQLLLKYYFENEEDEPTFI